MAKSRIAKRDRSRGDARWKGTGGGSIFSNMLKRPSTSSSNNALLWGIAWLIIGVIASWKMEFVATSMVGYTTVGYLPLIWHLAIGAAVWVAYGVVYFAFGVLRNRRTGVTEMFGRMLFAHWPITLLLVPGLFINRMAYASFMHNPGTAYLTYPTETIIMATTAVVVGLWTLYWGYLAFSRATQRTGIVSLLCYVVATPLAYYLSRWTLAALYEGMSW